MDTSLSQTPGLHIKLAPTDHLLEIQWLCHTYVGQLLNGCGNSACVEQYCWTGRKNAATRPVRRFTSRSARAIAFSIVGSDKPRKHLCAHYAFDTMTERIPDSLEATRDPVDDPKCAEDFISRKAIGPRDPSSWIQQLSDTSIMQQVCTLEEAETCASLMKSWREKQNDNEELATLRQSLQSALEAPFLSDGTSNPVFCSSHAAADAASSSLSWLLDRIPDLLQLPWRRINDCISKGLNVGLASTFGEAQGLACYDALNDQRSLSLLRQVCKVVAYRLRLDRIHLKQRKLSNFVNNKFGRTVVLRLAGATDLRSVGRDARSLSQPRLREILPYRLALITWLKIIILENWTGDPTITETSAAYGALELIQSLLDEDQIPSFLQKDFLPIPAFGKKLNAPDIARSWIFSGSHLADAKALPSPRTRQNSVQRNTIQLLSYGFVFGQKATVVFFRTINHLRMRDAHSFAEEAEALRRRITNRRPIDIAHYEDVFKLHEEHYLLLNIERDYIVRDTFDQIWQRRKGELFRPLRVRLGEADEREVGTDLGGVQIEFFNLFCKELFQDASQIFVSDSHTGLSWFAHGSLQPLHMFELSGLMLSLAIYNGITLPIGMPLAFYKLLLGLSCESIEDLQDGWPTISRSLAYVRDNEVDGTMDYSFPLEANGMRMEVSQLKLTDDTRGGNLSTLEVSDFRHIRHHASSFQTSPSHSETGLSLAWPGWNIASANSNEPIKQVTESNKHEYVRDYVRWLTTSSVWPQWQAFARGFHTILSPHTLSVFQKSPSTFKLLVEGQPGFDLSSLRLHAKYEGYSPRHSYMEDFWTVVLSWPQEKQKQLLKFVTAAERIPIGGVESLTFVIKRRDAIDAEWLPTSSTCFGILYLPEYKDARTLEEKLSQAIAFGNDSFGTG